MYRATVKYNYQDRISWNDDIEIRRWCSENCSSDWYFSPWRKNVEEGTHYTGKVISKTYVDPPYILFEKIEDAVAFKIIYGGILTNY